MKNPITRGTSAKGAYFKCKNEELQDHITEVASQFHIRDGKESEDGSTGTVKISYHQLLDALMCSYAAGFQDGFDEGYNYVYNKMSAKNN